MISDKIIKTLKKFQQVTTNLLHDNTIMTGGAGGDDIQCDVTDSRDPSVMEGARIDFTIPKAKLDELHAEYILSEMRKRGLKPAKDDKLILVLWTPLDNLTVRKTRMNIDISGGYINISQIYSLLPTDDTIHLGFELYSKDQYVPQDTQFMRDRRLYSQEFIMTVAQAGPAHRKFTTVHPDPAYATAAVTRPVAAAVPVTRPVRRAAPVQAAAPPPQAAAPVRLAVVSPPPQPATRLVAAVAPVLLTVVPPPQQPSNLTRRSRTRRTQAALAEGAPQLPPQAAAPLPVQRPIEAHREAPPPPPTTVHSEAPPPSPRIIRLPISEDTVKIKDSARNREFVITNVSREHINSVGNLKGYILERMLLRTMETFSASASVDNVKRMIDLVVRRYTMKNQHLEYLGDEICDEVRGKLVKTYKLTLINTIF
jgi:hypothetical protein